jgi:hypothetical protein
MGWNSFSLATNVNGPTWNALGMRNKLFLAQLH